MKNEKRKIKINTGNRNEKLKKKENRHNKCKQ